MLNRMVTAALLGLMMKLLTEADEQLGNLNLDGARRLAGAAEAGGVRQMVIGSQAVVQRRQHGADRTRIDAAVGVPAHAAIDGTGIQTRAAANAEQALAQRTAEDSRAATTRFRFERHVA